MRCLRFGDDSEEFDGFGIVAGFFKKRRGGIEIFVRIAHHGHQPAQELKRPGHVASRKSNFGEPQEVGSHELMILYFASENKFDQFASRLFVTGVKKVACCRSKYFRRGCGRRIGAVAGDLRVERSQLHGRLQFEWNERGRASALRFDREGSQVIRGLGELLGLNEIFYPLDLPRPQIFLRAIFLEPLDAR